MNKKEYKEYLKSKHWKEFKIKYYKKFKKICFDCENEKRIQLHHKNYLRLWCEEFTDVVALCGKCHKKRHFYKIKQKKDNNNIKLLNIKSIERWLKDNPRKKWKKKLKKLKYKQSWNKLIIKAKNQLKLSSKRFN